MPASIRTAAPEDAPAIADLTCQLGYRAEAATMRPRLERLLAREDQLLIVAENADRKVVGWLQVVTSEVIESGLRTEIVGLVIADRSRRQGIGRQLVARAEAWAQARGAPMMVVRSNLKRTESHAFYPSLGYIHTKDQAVYRKAL